MYARVKRVESNPLYQGMASSADVALVELDAPVTFTNYILPVCVPDPSVVFETGMNCWVTGWGSPSEEGNGAEPGEGADRPAEGQCVVGGTTPTNTRFLLTGTHASLRRGEGVQESELQGAVRKRGEGGQQEPRSKPKQGNEGQSCGS